MDNAQYVAMILSILILLASMISVELGVKVAIVEIVLGWWRATPSASRRRSG